MCARYLANSTSARSCGPARPRVIGWDGEGVSVILSQTRDVSYRNITGRELAPTVRFAERLAAMGKRVWVRFTLVPGQTDDPANIEGIAKFVAPMRNVEWVEVQPFHQLGAFKWKALNLDYKHAKTPPPSLGLINRVLGQFHEAGCNAR